MHFPRPNSDSLCAKIWRSQVTHWSLVSLLACCPCESVPATCAIPPFPVCRSPSLFRWSRYSLLLFPSANTVVSKAHRQTIFGCCWRGSRNRSRKYGRGCGCRSKKHHNLFWEFWVLFFSRRSVPPVLATAAASTDSSCSLLLGHTFACAHITSVVASWIRPRRTDVDDHRIPGSQRRHGRTDLGCAHCWTAGVPGTDRPCAVPRLLAASPISWGVVAAVSTGTVDADVICSLGAAEMSGRTTAPATKPGNRHPTRSRILPIPSRALLISAIRNPRDTIRTTMSMIRSLAGVLRTNQTCAGPQLAPLRPSLIIQPFCAACKRVSNNAEETRRPVATAC